MTEPEDRIRRLAEQIASGTYRVDSLAVADEILRRIRMEDVVAAFDDQSNDGSGTSDSSD